MDYTTSATLQASSVMAQLDAVEPNAAAGQKGGFLFAQIFAQNCSFSGKFFPLAASLCHIPAAIRIILISFIYRVIGRSFKGLTVGTPTLN
jgi:hypothetical protein